MSSATMSLARPGDGVDGDGAEHLLFCLGDIGVAGADDLVHAGDALRAVGERGDCLRAADLIDAVHARELCRGEDGGIDAAVRPRRGHDDEHAAARELCRHAVHQQRRGICRRAVRHIQPHALDGRDLLTEHDAVRLRHGKARPNLVAVVGRDVLRREAQHRTVLLAHRLICRLDLRVRHAQGVEPRAVKLLRIAQKRRVAVLPHVGQNLRHDRAHVRKQGAADEQRLVRHLAVLKNSDHDRFSNRSHIVRISACLN